MKTYLTRDLRACDEAAGSVAWGTSFTSARKSSVNLVSSDVELRERDGSELKAST